MKLAKLSLAAILAAGTFSVANAASLENAIKGVTLNGMLRVRYYNESADNTNTYNRWRTNAIFIFGVPVGDNLKMVFRNSTQSNVYADDDTLNANGNTSVVDSNFVNNLLFMQYSNGPVNAIAGKIPVATPITSADIATPGHGAGAIASYNVGNGLTLAGAYVDALESESVTGSVPAAIKANGTPVVDANGNITGYTALGFTTNANGTAIATPIGNTIYALAAIYKNDMISGQAWYFHVTNLLKYVYTLQATVKPIEGLSIHGDYANSKLDINGAKSKTFYNLHAQYTFNGFTGMIGYANADKDVGIISVGDDAPIGAVITAANRYNISNMVDTDAIYGRIGYNVDAKTNVYAQYASVDDGTAANDDSDEYAVGASYQYNQKLRFSAYYDVLDWDLKTKNDNNEFRFEARYNF